MTALEYVNAMIWPGNLGQLLACTAKVIAKPEHLPDDVLRHAAEKHRAADDWEAQPWLEVSVRIERIDREGRRTCTPRQIAVVVPVSAELGALAETVHEVALYVMESELLESARLAGVVGPAGRVWRTGIFAPLRSMPDDAAWQAPT
jgi:hypothetical protein